MSRKKASEVVKDGGTGMDGGPPRVNSGDVMQARCEVAMLVAGSTMPGVSATLGMSMEALTRHLRGKGSATREEVGALSTAMGLDADEAEWFLMASGYLPEDVRQWVARKPGLSELLVLVAGQEQGWIERQLLKLAPPELLERVRGRMGG